MLANIFQNFIGEILFFEAPLYFYKRQYFKFIWNFDNPCDFANVGRFEGNIVYFNVFIAFIGDSFEFDFVVLAT